MIHLGKLYIIFFKIALFLTNTPAARLNNEIFTKAKEINERGKSRVYRDLAKSTKIDSTKRKECIQEALFSAYNSNI